MSGIRPPRNWKTFTLCFDLDETWPTELRLTPDSFQLHVVPITNMVKDTADPIECDGMRERYPVPPPRPRRALRLSLAHRRVRHDPRRVEAARAGGGGRRARELRGAHGRARRRARQAWLALNLPNAFEEPQRVVVDAYWHQPELRDLRMS